MELVGKTLKSKINGNLFQITELFTEQNRQYYIVLDLSSGNRFVWGKEWFEFGLMQNLEIVS